MKKYGIKRKNGTWLICFYGTPYSPWTYNINDACSVVNSLTYAYGPNQFSVEEYND